MSKANINYQVLLLLVMYYFIVGFKRAFTRQRKTNEKMLLLAFCSFQGREEEFD